jgi:hypothetical protein
MPQDKPEHFEGQLFYLTFSGGQRTSKTIRTPAIFIPLDSIPEVPAIPRCDR